MKMGDGQQNRSHQDARKAFYASMRELVTEYLNRKRSRMWASWTRAGMGFQTSLLAAVLNLNQNGVTPCTLSETGERLLMTGPSAKTQTGQNHFVVGHQQLPGYFSTGAS